MADTDPVTPTRRRGQGFWLTAGEIVGVLALVIAGLNFWESHRAHVEEDRRQAAASRAATAFVAVGEAVNDGKAIDLRPLKSAQAIQSERYRFPSDVLAAPRDVTAERPRIELDWIVGGLKQALDHAHAKSSGSARTPVIVETVYVEDGDTRTDVSLYEVGFSWKREFLAGWRVRLTGVALSRRGLAGEQGPLLERAWAQSRRRFAVDVAIPPG